MSITNGTYGYGDPDKDLDAQLDAAQNKILQPADPVAFIKWVRESTRDHSQNFDRLREEHKKLVHAGDLATIGLTRVEGLIAIDQQPQLQFLKNLHRDFTFKNQAISRVLDGCQQTLRELITNYQMVAEGLGNPLADRHKKIAIQKELGLRLKDLEDDSKRCSSSVDGQHKLNKQLSEGIQLLLSKASVKLAPKQKEDITREDEIRRIAMNLKKTLQEGHDAVNYVPYNPKSQQPPEMVESIAEAQKLARGRQMSGFGQADTSTFSFKAGAAAITVGAILGLLVFSRFKLL